MGEDGGKSDGHEGMGRSRMRGTTTNTVPSGSHGLRSCIAAVYVQNSVRNFSSKYMNKK